ncbi:protein NipSnap homolog isoform X2 [Corticium candelabrum]|nr:protein NipSnap homolog isoform X2 [Corticium candelabrum]
MTSRDLLLEKVTELGDVSQSCVSQQTIMLHLFPWCEVGHPATEGGIYEYRSYTLKPGVLAQWSHRFQQGIHARMLYSKPLGVWFSEIGPLNAVHHIWHYNDLDHRMEVRNQALEDELWRETVRDGSVFLTTMMSRIIRPTPHSNWK